MSYPKNLSGEENFTQKGTTAETQSKEIKKQVMRNQDKARMLNLIHVLKCTDF